MKYYLAKIGRKILSFVFKNRLGRHRWSAKSLFWLIGQFDRFEVYENTSDIGNKDHYVPKLLLRNFKIAESGTNKGKIWEFSFKRNTVEKADINSAAAQIDFYTYKDKSGAKSDYIEKKLFSQTLERFGSMVINRLKETTGEPDLTYLEESTLAVFIAHQITRVPSFYAAIEKFIVFLYSKGQLKISDLGDIGFLRSKIAKNEIGVSLDDLMAFDSKIHIDGAKNHTGILSTLIATEMAESIYRGNLHILDIPQGSKDQFVISDNPIVLLDFDRSEILKYPAWWTINKESIWIFFTISPTRCVFYCKSKRKESVVERENNDLPQLVNFGQYLNSGDSVFSKDENVLKAHLKLYAKELINLRL